MTIPVLETLFYPFASGAIDLQGPRTLFLNAQYDAALEKFKSTVCIQFFKPYADALIAHGFSVPEGDEGGEGFDVCLIALPKNIVEARFLVARGLQALRAGGMVVAAADNKAGGGRLIKMMQEFGLTVRSESRNKCRVVWAQGDGFDVAAVQAALVAGAEQPILDGAYVSQPGIFGWDKVDAGSALLAAYLPERFSGRGADFGCGYGYLSRIVADRGPHLKALHAIDADARAVDVCARNVPEARLLWADITRDKHLPNDLDFIVMNPPFHEGKATDAGIGTGFVQQAARSLKKGGMLWMVANAHLPYETVLESNFSSVERLAQVQGFKVFKATR